MVIRAHDEDDEQKDTNGNRLGIKEGEAVNEVAKNFKVSTRRIEQLVKVYKPLR